MAEQIIVSMKRFVISASLRTASILGSFKSGLKTEPFTLTYPITITVLLIHACDSSTIQYHF